MLQSEVVIGLGYGDEGKGMAVLHDTSTHVRRGQPVLNVRFNGGPQAAHNVRMVRDGNVLHHTHSQFGSGTLLGARTVIASGMLFDPLRVEPEACHLFDLMGEDVMGRLMVDRACNVILPSHVAVNRALELSRGESRHGSTGSGIGVARSCQDAGLGVELAEVLDGSGRKRIGEIAEYLYDRFHVVVDVGEQYALVENAARQLVINGMQVTDDAAQEVRDSLSLGAAVIFEGAQGILLDERYGSFPHVTYGDMTPDGALAMAPKAEVIGVTRSYATRHGNGPLPYEGSCDIPEVDNGETEWAGGFRTALLSMESLGHAADAVMPDSLIISHLDRYPGSYVDACGHERRADEGRLISAVERACRSYVCAVGRGPLLDQWADI